MKERPILFSAPMIRALLAGTKTQTRRIVKGLPSSCVSLCEHHEIKGAFWQIDADGNLFNGLLVCPYGVPGDRLWVRESGNISLDKKAFMYADHGGKIAPHAPAGSENWCREWKSCPSIHMPRWASRILLEIVSVRVERLQDISEADAKAEGCNTPMIIHADEPKESYNYAFAYRHLWESINGAGSWAANPWVWAVEFKRVNP